MTDSYEEARDVLKGKRMNVSVGLVSDIGRKVIRR